MSDFVQDALVLKSSSKPCGNNGHVYNIQVNTPENGDEWFGCGFEDPKLNVGDECEFEVEQVEGGKYTNVIIDTIVVTKAAPQREQSSRGRGGNDSSRGSSRGSSSRGNSRSSNSRGSSTRGGRDSQPARGRDAPKGRGRGGPKEDAAPKTDWVRKDNLIRLQSCQNTAIATIAVMLTNGFIAFPKNKADRYDAIQALIEDEAQRLFFKYEDIVDGKVDGGNDQGQEQDEYPEDDVPS